MSSIIRFKAIYQPRIRTRHYHYTQVEFDLDSADSASPHTEEIFRSVDLQRDRIVNGAILKKTYTRKQHGRLNT